MFQIAKSKTYLWPVEIKTPTDTGEPLVEAFKAEFARLSADEITKIFAEENGLTVEGAFDEFFTGWRDILEGDKPLEVTPENRARLLNVPGMRAAIIRSWIESNSGNAARRKN